MVSSAEPSSHPLIESFMSRLVDPRTNRVIFCTLAETDGFLRRAGFDLVERTQYGPVPAGRLLRYTSRTFTAAGKGMQVRIKTHGEKRGKHRAFRPHLSVTWAEGMAEGEADYLAHEHGKYNPSGQLEQKSAPAGDARVSQSWADRTHPLFPGFEDSCESNPRGLHGADELAEVGAHA